MRHLPDIQPLTLTVLHRAHPATREPKHRVLDDPNTRRPYRSRHLAPEQRDWLSRNLDPNRDDLICLVTLGPRPVIIGWVAQTTYAS